MMAFDAQAETDDAVLLAAFAKGDQSAARALSLRHVPRLMRLARRMLRDEAEAEDIVQEAMLRMWKIGARLGRGPGQARHLALYGCHHLCTDRLRRGRRISGDEVPDTADETPSVETGLMARDRATALSAAIGSLRSVKRLAISLRHLEECSNPEIADIMGLSVEAVESLLSRGRRALKAGPGTPTGRVGSGRPCPATEPEADMTDHRDDALLDALFAEIKRQEPDPAPALMARILADAGEIGAQHAAARRPLVKPAPRPRRRVEIWQALGGWSGGGALAASALFGLALGFSDSAVIDSVADPIAAYAGLSDSFSFQRSDRYAG